MAAAIAYYALLSIFPLLLLLVSVASLVIQHTAATHQVATAVAAVLPVAGTAVSNALQQVPAVGAGGAGLLGLAGLVWSASGVFGALRTSINRAFDISTRRPFLRGKLVDVAMAAGVGVVLLASAGVIAALQVARSLVGALPAVGHALAATGGLWTAVSAATSLVLCVLLLGVLYRLVPARRLRLRDVWPGIVVGAVLLQASEYGFALYVGSVSHYDVVYGSLGTIVAFMVWVYLAALAMLTGAEVASEYAKVRSDGVTRLPSTAPAIPLRRWVRLRVIALFKG